MTNTQVTMNKIEKLQKELEQTQLAYQMAAQMSEFKAGFLARTSHELRSPLSSLIGLHQLILADLCESPEEQKEFIIQAYNSAMKLMSLIDEIVAVSKTEYGTSQLKMESLQLTDIFTQIYNLTHLQAANRNLRLEIVPPDYALFAHADRPRLIQSISNLIDCGITMMNVGNIKVLGSHISDRKEIQIEIIFDCAFQKWQAEAESETNHFELSNDLDEIRNLVENISLSPKMRFLLSQTLVETMGGSLQICDSSNGDSIPKTTIALICQKG